MSEETESHSPCCLSRRESETCVAAIVEELRHMGFRRTRALVELIGAMVRRHHPYTVAQLAEQPTLRDRDQATIYRLLMKLKEVGKVRQLSLAGRASHFQMILPGHHHDYLLCQSCGTVSEVPVACTLDRVEHRLMAQFGWQGVHHELEFYGVCPSCATE